VREQSREEGTSKDGKESRLVKVGERTWGLKGRFEMPERQKPTCGMPTGAQI